jgi:hypothetical protein
LKYSQAFSEGLKIKQGNDDVWNATVGVNRRNDGKQIINDWLGINYMEKTRTFLEMGYRYVHKYIT